MWMCISGLLWFLVLPHRERTKVRLVMQWVMRSPLRAKFIFIIIRAVVTLQRICLTSWIRDSYNKVLTVKKLISVFVSSKVWWSNLMHVLRRCPSPGSRARWERCSSCLEVRSLWWLWLWYLPSRSVTLLLSTCLMRSTRPWTHSTERLSQVTMSYVSTQIKWWQFNPYGLVGLINKNTSHHWSQSPL